MVFTVRTTIEVIGYPEEHIKEVTQKVSEKLKNDDGIKVIKEEIHPIEKANEHFFATFIEVDMKINDFAKLLNFCYDYLPSGIEILDTEKVTIPIREFSAGLNEMLAKLHHYNLVLNNLANKSRSKAEKKD